MVGVQYTMSVLLCSHDGLHCALLGTELTVPGVPRWWFVVVVVAVVSSHPALHSPHHNQQVERREIQCPGEARWSRDFSDHFRRLSRSDSQQDVREHLQYLNILISCKLSSIPSRRSNGIEGVWILHYVTLSNKQ